MYRSLKIAVVIPAFEESCHIEKTVRDVPEYVDQIIVIDDGSRDDTADIVARIRTETVELIQHKRNQGVGAAIVTGYQHALRLPVDAVVVIGADGQMDPSEMSTILDPIIDEGVDYVKGDRFGHPDVLNRMPLIRLLGSIILTRATRWATGYPNLRDSQCGYTAICADTLRRLPLDTLYPRYGFPNDLLIKLALIDSQISQRTVTPIYGQNTSKMRITRVVFPLGYLLVKASMKRLLFKLTTRVHPRRNSDTKSISGDASPSSLRSSPYADSGSSSRMSV